MAKPKREELLKMIEDKKVKIKAEQEKLEKLQNTLDEYDKNRLFHTVTKSGMTVDEAEEIIIREIEEKAKAESLANSITIEQIEDVSCPKNQINNYSPKSEE